MAETPSELQAEVEKLERKHLENPTGRYFVPLANAYRKIGELELAEERLREGLRKHPEYLSAHIVLGRVLADRGAGMEAAEEFRYVLSVDPQNLIALRTLGELAMAEGRTEEAGRWYRELLGVDPMNDEARQALSELDARAAAAPVSEPAAEESAEIGWQGPGEGEPELVLADTFPAAEESIGLAPGFEDSYGSLTGDTIAAEDEGGEAEFVTETIAELYARQGFYDRAADVYRQLIRERGVDEALERRLAEVERMAAGLPALAEGAGDVIPAGADADESIQLLEGLDLGVFGSELSPEPIEGLDLDEGFGAEVGADEPVGDSLEFVDFVDLDSLPSGMESAPAAADAFADSFVAGFAGVGSELEASAAWAAEPVTAVEPEPVPLADEGGTVAAVLGELLSWRPAAQPAAPVAEPAFEEAVALEALEEAEPIAAAEEEPLAEADDSPAGFSFDEYFGADAEPEPAEPAPTLSEPAPAADEEEDLESFQAWLRSLKR